VERFLLSLQVLDPSPTSPRLSSPILHVMNRIKERSALISSANLMQSLDATSFAFELLIGDVTSSWSDKLLTLHKFSYCIEPTPQRPEDPMGEAV